MSRRPSEKHYPQPLFTAEHLFQFRAASDFDQIRTANAAAQKLEGELAVAVANFHRMLPIGYSQIFVEQPARGEPLYAFFDDCHNDVGWPLTQCEGHTRSWNHVGLAQPRAGDDPDVRRIHGLLAAARARSAEAGQRIDATHRATVGETSNQAAHAL